MELQIKNVGPVSKLSLPIPEGGGVVVLRGRNGAGKSTVLDAAQALIKGKGKLACKDGERCGEVAGWGAKITVGQTTRRSGELDVISLEGRLDVSQLVDPGIADPAAADARRIKALLALTGASVPREAFAAVFPQSVPLDTIPHNSTGDPVEYAAIVKRAAESEARRIESARDAAREHARGLLASVKDAPAVAADAGALQAALERAIAREAELRAEQAEAARREDAAREAREALDSVQQGRPVEEWALAVTDAQERLAAQIVAVAGCRAALEKAEAELATAEADAQCCRAALEAAEIRLAAAQKLGTAIAGWRATIEASESQAGPIPEEIARAAQITADARAAVEQGAIARHAVDVRAEAESLAAAADGHAESAAALRETAAAIDDVLSGAVACDVLRVSAGRLVTITERGFVPFGELSQGERWSIALELATRRVGRGGVVPVPQEAWEGLDPDNRAAVARVAASLGVVVLTAEADRGDIRAEAFTP